jgi:hypothetical protein
MRDLVAGLLALFLLLVAAILAGTLQKYRAARRTAREAQRTLGREIVAELPVGADLLLFAEDDEAFYYGDSRIDKNRIRATRVLINGSPIAAYVSRRFPAADLPPPTSFEDRPEGIARDRWDVALETETGMTLVECGAIRERVSQELARKIFDAVRRDLEERDAGAPPTTRPPASRL